MCVDCVLASPRIAQVDPGNEPLPEVVLSHISPSALIALVNHQGRSNTNIVLFILHHVSLEFESLFYFILSIRLSWWNKKIK
jgi:hypothetical protein